MSEVGAYEAKTKLAQLLNRVAAGDRIVITRHGMPVAVLEPVPPAREKPARQVISELRAFRRGHRLNGLALPDMIAKGRE